MRPVVQSTNLLWTDSPRPVTSAVVSVPGRAACSTEESTRSDVPALPRQAGGGQDVTDTSAISRDILLVDDDSKLCELLKLYLEAHGFRVTTALTAARARELMDKGKFHIAVLDINLNGESGLDLLDAMKAKDPNVRVLMFTGLDVDHNLVQKSLKGRAEGIIRKTQALGTVLSAIQRLV